MSDETIEELRARVADLERVTLRPGLAMITLPRVDEAIMLARAAFPDSDRVAIFWEGGMYYAGEIGVSGTAAFATLAELCADLRSRARVVVPIRKGVFPRGSP